MENRTNLTFLIDLVTHWVLILFYRELSIFFYLYVDNINRTEWIFESWGDVVYNLGSG